MKGYTLSFFGFDERAIVSVEGSKANIAAKDGNTVC